MENANEKQLALYLGCEAEVKAISDKRLNKTKIDPADLICLELYEYVKPILRPLADITEEEAKKLAIIFYGEDEPEFSLEKDKYGIFLNPDSDDGMKLTIYTNGSMDCLCLDNNENYPYPGPEIFAYLLSKGFDLFNWIEQGLAIDKTKIQ